MNDLQVMNINGVECYEKDGIAYLKLEAVARKSWMLTSFAKRGTQ